MLHAPTSSTQKLSWWGKVGNSLILQHSPSREGSPRLHTWILEWAVIILINVPVRIRTQDLWPGYHIELRAPTSSTQKLKLMRKCGQFNTTIYRTPKKTRGGGGAILLYLLLSSIGLTHGSLGKEILNFYPARQSWLPGLGRLQTHHPEEEMNILQNIQE
jgi:hypothetical protein